jgi:hypothetical protein
MTPVPGGEVLVYETPDGEVRVDVRLDRDTVWLTQRQMADLFDSSTDNIGLHLKNIFADNELGEAVTTEDFSVVQSEGNRRVRRQVKHYNLDAIISVGYRVHSRRGVRFRQWATGTLREHLVRGGEPVINDVGLAALALLVAESAPKDKEVMIRLVMNMLAEPNALSLVRA